MLMGLSETDVVQVSQYSSVFATWNTVLSPWMRNIINGLSIRVLERQVFYGPICTEIIPGNQPTWNPCMVHTVAVISMCARLSQASYASFAKRSSARMILECIDYTICFCLCNITMTKLLAMHYTLPVSPCIFSFPFHVLLSTYGSTFIVHSLYTDSY